MYVSNVEKNIWFRGVSICVAGYEKKRRKENLFKL